MRTHLVIVLLVSGAAAILAAGCSVIDRVEPTPEPAPTATQPSGELTETPTSAPDPTPTPQPSPTPTVEPTPEPTATPEPTPTPTPVPEDPFVSAVTETPCCGLFDWIRDDQLIVYEADPTASFRVDLPSVERQRIADGYGLASPAGIIAIIRSDLDQVRIIEPTGEEIRTVSTSSNVAWPSPDGSRIALLERLPVSTPSSTVDRSVELRVADVSTGEVRSVIRLQAADIQWLPDNRHVLVSARDLNFEQAGIWLIDTEDGSYDVLFEEIFIRAMQISPDGESVAFLRTFNDDPDQNGVWVMDLETRDMRRVFESGSFRWARDSQHLWRLDMTDTGAGNDLLTRIRIESGEEVQRVELEGQVLNQAWSVSPEGTYAAFWRVSDELVVAQSLE